MSPLATRLAFCFALAIVVAAEGQLAAQCSTQWLPGQSVAGTDGVVYATTLWDPDGVGPLQPVLVVGGSFQAAGSALASNIALYDPGADAWSALGSGTNYTVSALAVLSNGDLVAGGFFTSAGGVSASCIARWNGTSWSALGSGLSGSTGPGVVYALTALPNGDLVAGGSFTSAGGVGAANIARWDGTNWSALGTGIGNPGYPVYAVTTLPNGDLVAGGYFVFGGGVVANFIARWNGTSWSALGLGLSGQVNALTTLPNGDVVAGGSFSFAGGAGANSIARWNGASWSPLGTGISHPTFSAIYSLATLPNGALVAGGNFTVAGGVSAANIASWNGTSWSLLGSGVDFTVRALTILPNGDLAAGGGPTSPAGSSAVWLARWNGASWSPLGSGMNGRVSALTTLPNGDLIAGGSFALAGSVSASHVARWNGTTWSALSSGINGDVSALTTLPNGDLVAAGAFTSAGGVSASHIAQWNGTTWSALGSGINGDVSALTTLPNGDLVAGGRFTVAGGVSALGIARWNGTSWSALGTGVGPPVYEMVYALTTLPNGDLVAGGYFTVAGGVSASCIARWNGTSWSALGSGLNSQVNALTTLPTGDLVAGGYFTVAGGVSASRIARWDGTSWSALGSGVSGLGPNVTVFALTTLPNGDLAAGGNFSSAGGASANSLARWDGTSWSALGSGISGSLPSVNTLVSLRYGDLVAGGNFSTAGGLISACIAQLTTTCPATATSFGAGCTGSAGPNVLAATSLPWTGSMFRAVATGMPAISLVLSVLGLTTASVPLPSILPQGVAGCTLWVSPDLLTVYLPSAGSVTTQIAIPNTVVLAGQILHQQVVPIELDAASNIVALTSTNALTLTIGAF